MFAFPSNAVQGRRKTEDFACVAWIEWLAPVRYVIKPNITKVWDHNENLVFSMSFSSEFVLVFSDFWIRVLKARHNEQKRVSCLTSFSISAPWFGSKPSGLIRCNAKLAIKRMWTLRTMVIFCDMLETLFLNDHVRRTEIAWPFVLFHFVEKPTQPSGKLSLISILQSRNVWLCYLAIANLLN